ncbi:hypothetical protein BV20DRAFT_907861, partial [Pilatotrama ljubarskyi]
APTTPSPHVPSLSDATLTLLASQSNCLFDIAKLKDDGSNFPMWKFQLQMILETRKLWDIISRTERCP